MGRTVRACTGALGRSGDATPRMGRTFFPWLRRRRRPTVTAEVALPPAPRRPPVPHPFAAVLRRAALALAIAAALAPALMPPPAQAADWSGFYTDFASEELMRLTNLDRRALGRSA